MNQLNTSILFKSYLDGSGGYTGGPGLDEIKASVTQVYKLSSNENPMGPSPKALKALREASLDVHIYPDRTPIRMQQALSTHYQNQLSADQFLVANSGSEVLELIMRAFLSEGTEYIYSPPCFSPYKMFANWQGARGVSVPLNSPHFELDIEGILAHITEHTRLIFLTSPNNPTGTYIPQESLETLLQNVPNHVVVVLDEVYFHFAEAEDFSTALPYVQQGYPIIAVNSFSKTYGLAALRLGYGYASPQLAQYVGQLIRPFFINAISMQAGLAALKDQAFVSKTVDIVWKERKRLYADFNSLPLTYWKSQGNFILVRPEMEADVLEKKLLEKGIMVREMKSFGAPGCLRITIGTEEANDALVKALNQIMG